MRASVHLGESLLFPGCRRYCLPAFGATPATLRNWANVFDDEGTGAWSLGSGLSKAKQTFERILPPIRWLLGHGLNCQRIADLTEDSEFSIRRALTLENRAAFIAMTHFPPAISDAEVLAVHHPEGVLCSLNYRYFRSRPIAPASGHKRPRAKVRGEVPAFAPASGILHAGPFFAQPARKPRWCYRAPRWFFGA